MPSTHQFHSVILEWIGLLESSGYSWKIQGCTIYGELFIKVIEDVGVDSCVQIITDNAHVCKVVDCRNYISTNILDTMHCPFLEFST